MPYDLDDLLVVGVASSVLFDLANSRALASCLLAEEDW